MASGASAAGPDFTRPGGGYAAFALAMVATAKS